RSYTTIAEFAVHQPERAIFITADWDTATQIYSLSNARADFGFEPFWDADSAASTRAVHAHTGADTMYLLTLRARPIVFPLEQQQIVRTVEQAAEWREVPVESDVQNLSAVRVRKVVRTLMLPN
ncbi:MAG: hypothetical protein LC737_00385, partial [Chloroflexi bacterium]|nr:hypothetical protein [Chloroflexota bacterium]